MVTQTIPVLDLQDFFSLSKTRQDTFVLELGNALRDIGFFALTNHSVDSSVIQAAYTVATQFFELPDAVKLRYEGTKTRGQRGYTCFGKEHAKDHPVPDLKEFWHLGRAGAAERDRRNLYPAEIPEFQPVMDELFQQLEACSAVLLEACALYLDLPRTFLSDMIRDGNTLLRIIHYPPIPADAPAASIRAAAHEDINFITLLCEATAPGLELKQRDGSWLPIQALPGQIIVDTGDMLQNLTNGLLRSTTHRVANPDNDKERRFSIPFFVHPRAEVDLTPLAGCVDKTGGEARYPSWTAGEYLTQRLKEIGLA
ncbi:isopenicillin N synthase family dioxygenase [Leptolyngbya sp. AN02str]|uniref:isopenicillin N synthase family dioxygenase n=1 Tax=Leptolyngbya sp. AN02str TaxID=3423363 RepID=UPI003D31F73E